MRSARRWCLWTVWKHLDSSWVFGTRSHQIICCMFLQSPPNFGVVGIRSWWGSNSIWFLYVNSKLTWIIALLILLPVLYLDLKRHCDAFIYGLACDRNSVPRYWKQFKERKVAHLCGQPLFWHPPLPLLIKQQLFGLVARGNWRMFFLSFLRYWNLLCSEVLRLGEEMQVLALCGQQ